MNSIIVYASTVIHLILIFLLWRLIYKRIKPSKSRLNISIWIALIILIIYCVLILNLLDDIAIFENVFIFPAYLIGLFIPYFIVLNGCYSIILLIQKWISTPVKEDKKFIPTTLYNDTFQTTLGTIVINLRSDLPATENASSKGYTTLISNDDFNIKIIAFNDITKWVADSGFPVEDSKGWIIRIHKFSNAHSNLKLDCELKPNNTVTRSDIDSGEHLDAVCIEGDTHVLNIGTEDGEMMKSRAISNDDMPSRLSSELGYSSANISFTNYTDFGFETIVPELMKDESIYFHYLAAVNSRKKSKDYPDEDDISTHFAVDFSKRGLIKLLKLEK